MKCKNKDCKAIFRMVLSKNNFICSGCNKKPTKHKKDNVWLCFASELTKEIRIEMTKEEAQLIIASLSVTLVDNGIK